MNHIVEPNTNDTPIIRTIEESLSEHRRRRIDPDGLRRAAVAVPLLPAADGLAVLLTRRTRLVEHHKGEICFPGGRVDPEDEDSLTAALREAWEEVGIHPDHARVLGKLDDCVSVSGYRVRPYVIFVEDGEYPFAVEPREVEQLLLVPVAHLLDPGHHQILEPAAPGMPPGHRYLWRNHVIWGLTAAMLNQFLQLVFDGGERSVKDSLAQRVLSSMRCGVVAVDREGRVTLLNEQAARYLHLTAPPAPGEDCRQVFCHCPSVAHLLIDALHRSTLPDRAELELNLEGERQILMGFSLSRITDEAGETVGSAIFFKDLTLVEEEREREAMRNRLASLGEVAAQLAHEIRNRLGGIRLFLGLTRRRLEGDGEGLAYLERAENEVLESNSKMGEILDYVRPLKLDLTHNAIEAVCREALDSTLARYPEAAMDVRWEVAADLPDIPLDHARMRDALANLFANAVEAMRQAGCLTIRVDTEDATVLVSAPGEQDVPGLRGYGESFSRQVRIEIQDDGPGIPPEVLRRIFQPFFTTKDRGSGLGIPTTQKIIDAHAGSIDVMAWPNGGTKFIVRLPAPTAEEERRA